MILNCYEESPIKNSKLPPEWQSEQALDGLEEFLQKHWDLRKVFYEDNKVGKKQQFLGFTSHRGIRTNQYIGTISYKGSQINIFPKMFREEPDDNDNSALTQKHLMYNLVKWLTYSNKMSYPFINISTELTDENDFRELFITLYVGCVRHAVERGMYYQYVERTDNLNCIKGKFDVADYFRNKIPTGQSNKFVCTYSNFEYDNQVNRIIKATCKLLYPITSKRNQKVIRNVLIRMNDVSDIRCSPRDCDSVRLSSIHSSYSIIVSMSKAFLLNKTSTYEISQNESFCFLFPMDVLFQGFIGGYIKEVIELHNGHTRFQQSDMHFIDDISYAGTSLGSAFVMRHDIVVTLKDKMFILDTKYKQIPRFEGDLEKVREVVSKEPKETDIYQVCEYARKRNLNEVFLLYPMYRYEDEEPEFPVAHSKSDKGSIDIHFIRIPFVFEQDSEKTFMILKSVIHRIFNLTEET